MWSETIRMVNLDGMYRCVKCDKDVEYGSEGIDFEYENGHNRKICMECAEDYSMELSGLLFVEDINKIKIAVSDYPMGSHQVGEIVRLSGLLYDRGVDVVGQLNVLCRKYKVSTKDSQ